MSPRRLVVNPDTYGPLLQLIARAESNGNYNAYFGNAGNNAIDFTQMTITQVMAWQANYIRQGSPSSAVGRYQIINTTLEGLVRQRGIDTDRKFNHKTQDELAIALLERRGIEAYVNNELSRDEFAANLAKEWASFPKIVGPNPDQSYYHSDGLNRAHVRIDEVRQAIAVIAPK